MSKYFNRSLLNTIITNIVFIIVGIILILNPNQSLIVLSYIIGGAVIGTGIISFVKYLKANQTGMSTGFGMSYAIISLILGMILIIIPTLLNSIIPIILGIIITITGAFKIQIAFFLKKVNRKAWVISLLIAILIILIGLFLMFNPIKANEVITMIIGIVILIFSTLDIITTFIYKLYYKEQNVSTEIELIKKSK